MKKQSDFDGNPGLDPGLLLTELDFIISVKRTHSESAGCKL